MECTQSSLQLGTSMGTPTRVGMTSFDDFFSAFSRSVRANVKLQDNEIVVSHSGTLLNETLTGVAKMGAHPSNSSSRPISRTQQAQLLPQIRQKQSPTTPKAKTIGQTIADVQLPPHIDALVRLQQSDGSWRFDDKFAYSINGVAPPPPNGISPKHWASAVAVTVCRQSPEYFEQLEATYDKAMLHVDDNVLHLAKSHTDLTAVDTIRIYQNNEAREIRERLAREAAARRAEEDAEERRLEVERQTAKRISNYSMVKAKRLPTPVQELFIENLGTQVHAIFPRKIHVPDQLKPKEMDIKVGDVVECCWRRADGSTRPQVWPQWWLGKVTAIALDGKSLHLLYLDEPFERQRNVLFQYIRLARDDAKHRRALALKSLRTTWETPVPLDQEVHRLTEIESLRKWRKPWEIRSLPMLPTVHDSTESDTTLSLILPSPRRHTLVLDRRHAAVDEEREQHYQAAVAAALAYDKLYSRARAMVKKASQVYKNAMLFRERFDAFSDFLQFAVELVKASVVVLEAIEKWSNHLEPGAILPSPDIPVFMWAGSDLVVKMLQSLNFIGDTPAAVEWYGEDFAFTFNPFLRNESLRDIAQDRGLALTEKLGPIPPEHPLRITLRMHKDADREPRPIPTWWPEAHYDDGLRRRMCHAENFVLKHLQAIGAAKTKS